MTAANQIAQTIISDSYFLKLFRTCVERSALRILNISTEEKYTEKEFRDLLRFADLLSTSSISDARNYAYKIITYLNPYCKDNMYYQTVAKAVYSNLGNFPAISYLEADNNNTSNLPFDRSVQNEAKKLIQEVPDGAGHVFTDIQYDLFSKLISSREFSFSGPTSMGKSFVIKAFLRCAIQNTPQENFIILVPSRALINQYAIELKSEMGALLETNNYKIVTNSNIAELPINEQCNYVLILTPERLISYISQEKNPSIGFLFVDEAHKLAQTEDARSITTYTSIEKTLKKYPDIKLYFASPNVSNPEILLSMFRNSDAENTFKTQETPVAQNLYFIDLLEKELSYCLNDEFIPINHPVLADISSINDVLLRFGQRSNLIYCNAKSKAISYAKELAAAIECSDNKALKRAASIIRAYIHPDYYLADLVQKEIAYHFGNMPQLIRNLIEDLYRDGHLKYIFCTSTLLEGVNMPTQNLFILDDKKAKKILRPIDFWNLAGRAGRLAKELQGNVFCVKHGDVSWDKPSFFKEKDIQLVPTIYERIDHNLKKIEKIIQEQEISGTDIEQNILRYIANIICIDTLEPKNGYKSPIITALIERNKTKIIELATSKSAQNETPYLILSANESIELKTQNSAYKQLKYLHAQKHNILLPTQINYPNILETLTKLYKLYSWNDKYLGKENSLKYFAMLMNKWINNSSLSQIISESIDYFHDHNRKLRINNGDLVDFDKNDKTHINALIGNIIDEIEIVLRFQLEKYFNHYHMMVKNILGEDNAGENWAMLLEYGTQNREIIALQNMGLSRYSAQKIFKECRGAFISENGQLKKVDKHKVLSKLQKDSIEYIEAQRLL